MEKRNIKNAKQEIEFPEPSSGLRRQMEKEIKKEREKKREWQQREPCPHFGKLPHWIADSGLLEVLRPKTVKLLSLLVRRAHFITQNGRIGNKTISKECDIGERSVSGYFKELVFFGVIKTWREGWVRYYHIREFPPPDIERKIELYCKLDKYPRNTDIYHRDQKGRFIRKETLPKNSDMAYPKNTEPA